VHAQGREFPADMEVNGHLSEDKWHITAEELVATLVAMIDRQTRDT
jgi:hypothetical protein